MKTAIVSIGFLVISAVYAVSAVHAEPLKLTLSLSVAGEEAPAQLDDQSKAAWTRLSLIPTRAQILRKTSDEITFTDPAMLSKAFAVIHSELLFDPTTKEGQEVGPSRSQLIKFRKNIEELKVSSNLGEDQRNQLRLMGSAYNVFQNHELNQVFFLRSRFCKTNFEENSSDCSIVFPAIQPLGRKPSNISYVKVRVFIEGKISSIDLSRLPTEILQQKDEFLKENTRETTTTTPDETELRGYFLYANYHFDAATEAADAETPNPKKFEWRFALSQVQGRLALLAGNYIIEREIKFSDDKTVLERATVSLPWGKLLRDDPLLDEQDMIPWKEITN